MNFRILALPILCIALITACKAKNEPESSEAKSSQAPSRPQDTTKTAENSEGTKESTSKTAENEPSATATPPTTATPSPSAPPTVVASPTSEPSASPSPLPSPEAKTETQTATAAETPPPQSSPTPEPSASPTTSPSPSSFPQVAVAPVPHPPTSEEPKPEAAKKLTVASALEDNEGGVSRSMVQLLANDKTADEMESTRGKIVDDVFSNEDEMPAKVFELQVNVAKLEKEGLYSDDLKNRIGLLQTGITERARSENAVNRANHLANTGLFFAALGVTGGVLAGTGAYRALPKIPGKMASGWSKGQTWAREHWSKTYASTGNKLSSAKNTVFNRETWSGLGTSAKNGLVAGVAKPFRPVETVVFDNLEKLGVPQLHRSAITSLEPYELSMFSTIELQPTRKSGLQFAALGQWEGRELGIERVLLFKQRRLVRGYPYDVTLVTNPLPADVAGQIAATIERRAESSRFVRFFNRRTGEVTETRWSVEGFGKMMESAGKKLKPLFGTLDIPTTVGTGVATTGVMILAYNYGFEKGENAKDESDLLNLEALIPPRGTKSATGDIEK